MSSEENVSDNGQIQSPGQEPEGEGQPKESSALEPYITPGQILCEAREARGLNRAKVGQSLGLTETAVRDIEKNKYENFPGSVYVRGYLKNYAKVMGQNEEDIIALYDKYCLDHGLDAGKTAMEPLPENSGSGKKAKIALGVFILCALVFGTFIAIGQFA